MLYSSTLPMEASDDSEFLGPGGLPSAHLLRAALHVIAQIEDHGSAVRATQSGYHHYSSGALFPPPELQKAEGFLIEVGRLKKEDGYLYAQDGFTELASVPEVVAIEVLLADAWQSWGFPEWLFSEPLVPPPDAGEQLEIVLPDPDGREAFLLSMGRRFDDEASRRLGELGEKHVLKAFQAELEDLGCPELAGAVQRVSLVSDQLGYDIAAPRLDGSTRRVEVKASSRVGGGLVHIFLSRSEVEVGLRDADWSLAICSVSSNETVETLGWCRAGALRPNLPDDSPGGTWRVVELSINFSALRAGLPPAV